MLSTNPTRDSALVNLQLLGGDLLSPKMGDEVFVDSVHDTPPYGNTHILDHGNTLLQGYGRTRNNFGMEYKDRIKAARKHAKLTQGELGRIVGIDQTSISDLERGKSQSSSYNTSIAQACGVSAIWLEKNEGSMLDSSRDANGSPSEADYAVIPQFKARGACGDGYLNDHVEVSEGLAFKRDWLARMKAKPENLRIIYAEGDSMEPYVFDGDVVMFDSSSVEPRDRQAYVIRRPDGGISIKRMVQQMSGTWLIRSDNTDKAKYPDEMLSESALHEMPILGRVIWRGGQM